MQKTLSVEEKDKKYLVLMSTLFILTSLVRFAVALYQNRSLYDFDRS